MSSPQYDIIADTIDHLVAHYDEKPRLEALAVRAGYEPTHFQKLFKEYVGISPKRLVQYMNMRKARELMQDDAPLLDVAVDAGLSSPSRLHDLFVSCEGVTPGEVKARGAGLTITYGFYPTPLGRLMIGKTARGVCWLAFLVDEDEALPIKRIKAHWPRAAFIHDDAAIELEAQVIMNIWRGQGDAEKRLGLDLYGTNFQLQVWQALLRIPYGETVTYSDVGAQVGKPKAARAIGNAVGANPISLLIPCHRVIRATGIIDNYAWGSARKKLILAMELNISCT